MYDIDWSISTWPGSANATPKRVLAGNRDEFGAGEGLGGVVVVNR